MSTPKKHFGQHFLADSAVVERIVSVLAPRAGEHLIEIGPGQGALTLPVLRKTKQLEVIELDRDVLPELEARCGRAGDLTIHLADVLNVDFTALKQDKRPLRVFGNLPYNISTPLIFHLIKHFAVIADMVFMVQKEVADRLCALPHNGDYGRLSVMVQYHAKMQHAFDVPPSAFYPPPRVQSSVIRITPHTTLPVQAVNETLLSDVVRDAFNQRRKTIRNSLHKRIPDAAWDELNIKREMRPENLSVADFVAIANYLAKE